jgi:hypothetical protein
LSLDLHLVHIFNLVSSSCTISQVAVSNIWLVYQLYKPIFTIYIYIYIYDKWKPVKISRICFFLNQLVLKMSVITNLKTISSLISSHNWLSIFFFTYYFPSKWELGDWIQQLNKQGLIRSNNQNWSNRKLACEGQKRREEGTKPNSMYSLFNIFIELLFPLLLKLTIKELNFGFF